MSKQVTLATCIAKMYDGGKLDNAGVVSGTPKKANPTLLGTLGQVEEKLHILEVRVDNIMSTQNVVLQKLELVCQEMGDLEKNLARLREDLIKPSFKSIERGSGDSSELAEVRVLCSETVTLLRNLNQEGQLQRKKLEGIESSVSTLDKVLGYVGEAFRSSKIVEFILNGVVPWRKQGLLETGEEKNRPDDSTTQIKVPLCHQGTQAPEEIDEDSAVQSEHQEQNVTFSASTSISPVAETEAPSSLSEGKVAPDKVQRKAKEVTLKSREPGRVQAFAPQSHSESGVDKVLEVLPLETVALKTVEEKSTVSQPERVSEKTEMSEELERISLDLSMKEEWKERREEEQREENVPGDAKPIKENLEAGLRKEQVGALPAPELRGAEQEPETELVGQQTKSEPVDTVLEKHATTQEELDSAKDNGPQSPSAAMTKSEGQSKGSDSWRLIIDDCPPMPAPFEHRIVSAKQVAIGTYYQVTSNKLLGGGRFGQVHKCAEISSGLTLAAKIIKVKGMKERDEVKNEIGVMNQLNHVNLIQLYDAFESRTNLTLIMEYVEGGELFDRIVDEHYQLTELDAIVFTRQICEGVQYLHQQYILHLDLKPENILCVNSTGNQIKIIDFGLARKYRPREKLKVNFGTPEFLAPEVVNYDFVSFPTDMWSVGVITYMLLSGLSPFLGESDTETMNNILHAKWDFDAEAFENVSEEAKDFISRLLIPAKCSRLSASGCLKHSWLNNLEDKAKRHRVRLKSQMRLQRYLAAHRQWKKHFYAVAAANRLKRFQQNRSISTP